MGLSLAGSYWLSAGCIVVFFLLLLALFAYQNHGKPAGVTSKPAHQKLGNLIVGQDNRVSTSKVQFALWTVALAWALLVIAFHRFELPPGDLDPRYLLLIGFPAGAAVGAKAITTQKVASGTITKPDADGANIADIVTNDSGDLDLGDTQYFMFNLVALTAFFIAFFHNPTTLPALSDTLVGLTSGSAVAYVAKKAATGTSVTITAVSPQKGRAGGPLSIYGTNLCAGRVTTENPTVSVDGVDAPVQKATDSLVVAKVPSITPGANALTVEVVTPSGQTFTLVNAFTSTQATITAVSPQRGPAGTLLSIYGTNLCDARVSNENPKVSVNGLDAPVQGTATDSLVVVKVPSITPGPTALAVEVVTPSGQPFTLPNAFTVDH